MIKEKKVKVKKVKLPKKFCYLCGDDTDDWIVYMNGFVCKTCQTSEKFIKFKEVNK